MKISIQKSDIHGNGIFALQDFEKGCDIFDLKGKLVYFANNNKNDSLSNPDWVGIGKNLWMEVEKPGLNLNHSCKPNAGIKGEVSIVALQDIKQGEEITIDYSITEEDHFWVMDCHCNASICRKSIRSIQYLSVETINTYMPFVPDYFQKVYFECNEDAPISAMP